MLRILARVVLGLVAVVVAAGGWIWWSLRPPAALAVPEAGAVLSGVTVINPGADRRDGQRVVIEGDRIASITSDSDPSGPFTGAYVLPGLIDMHAHLPPASGLGQGDHFPFLFLYHGVTTVRSAGDVDGTAVAPVQRGMAEGRFPGPRVFDCGPFVDGEGARWANSRVLLDPGDARALVARLATEYDCIKTYDRLSPELAAAVHAAGREVGIPVIGHVPSGVRFAEAHVDDVQHMMGMAFAEGAAGPFPKSLKAWRGLDEEGIDEIVAAALEQRKALTPTLVVIERMSRGDDRARLLREADALLMPRVYRELVWAGSSDLDAEDYDGIRDAVPIMQRVILRLYEAGARLHMGTDPLVFFVVPGAGMHRELRLYVDAGLTPEEAWAVATRVNGASLALPDLGRLVPGAPADLLVFLEDPTRDPSALDSLVAVIAQGRLYTRDALDAQLERYQRYFHGWVFDTLSVAITRRVLARIAEPGPD